MIVSPPVVRMLAAIPLGLFLAGCSDSPSGSPVLTVDMPLHLEEHVEAAAISGSEQPAEPAEPIVWSFAEPEPAWTTLRRVDPNAPSVRMQGVEGALRVSLSETNRTPRGDELHGYMYVDLPALGRSDWSHILVRARSSAEIRSIGTGFNLRPAGDTDERGDPRQFIGDGAPVVNDGTVQTYRFRADWSWSPDDREWSGPWRQLVLRISADEPSSLDIISVTLVPKAAVYADSGVGVRTVTRESRHLRALYTHAPGRVAYRVRVPEGARLDVALGTLRAPVTFRVAAVLDADDENEETLLEETLVGGGGWQRRSIDLSHLAGRAVTLGLETDSERAGAVAFWGAPTVSALRHAARPNVIFYVIDGAAADYMSVYGYNRRTTPNLERLAAEGVVFEHAYSNSSWSKPSTTSFMTSLQNSVLGNTRGRFDPLPDEAVTMAEHFHRAGYQTAALTSNPWAGAMSSLDRGVDVMRDEGVDRDFVSSVDLQRDFWGWRDAYPGQPYWVHFQTTDVHEYETGQPAPVPPFSGLFVSGDTRDRHIENVARIFEWFRRHPTSGASRWSGEVFEETGVDRIDFFDTMRSLYDESMAHQDHQIGRLVERLKATGEWENTLLIIAADHSIAAAVWDLGVLLQDSLPPAWNHPMFRSTISRIPLLFVWPGHIGGGQRFIDPVSMIDVLPTLLDLVGLPQPDVKQGRSLAPLLLGTGDLEPRPVILDEFTVAQESGELRGFIEVIDGRWGASLEFNPNPERPSASRRPTPLLLYDLWDDPLCLKPANERHPELVERYTAFLESQWEAHQALAKRFTPGGEVELTPEQLQTLRTLGYIQ